MVEYIFTIVQAVWKKQVVRTLNYKIPFNTIEIFDAKTKGFEVNLNKEVKNKMYEYGKNICRKYFIKKKINKKKNYYYLNIFNYLKIIKI